MATINMSSAIWDIKGGLFDVWVRRYISKELVVAYDKKTDLYTITLPTEQDVAKLYIMLDQILDRGYPITHYWLPEQNN